MDASMKEPDPALAFLHLTKSLIRVINFHDVHVA